MDLLAAKPQLGSLVAAVRIIQLEKSEFVAATKQNMPNPKLLSVRISDVRKSFGARIFFRDGIHC
nr:hypothetical protein Iba_chr05cCG12280 [Ipomoea batatas]GMC99816.1 hypothetical protein Iba_chr05eCG9310 [Ipomoea batatas]